MISKQSNQPEGNAAMDTVKIWEENAIIPTYDVGKPDKNPLFLEKRVYQGSSGKIYPYPATNDISREKKDKIWKAVYLENEYIKVMILPELGGRIQRAYDKTNDYDFVYYNHVIKPALVGLTGPWISGGIEFNWPQHHRPTTYSPVDYKIVENEDGSKSLWTGDVDQMYGTKEVTIFTLYPGKAYIEITGQLYNRTPLPQTFLWWANPAVSVNDHTQSIFPPDVHNVYDHGKRAVSRFPIATGEYYKHDYSEGVDISRYKNIPVPTSYMAEKSDYDFIGGYDYQKEAGLLHIADHHISTGKKQWTWGCGDFGKAWDRNLTDEDGPYIELMTGMFCDNQPDFSWLKPYEEKSFKQYFMPYKKVGQVKNASISAALNVEGNGKEIYICIYATGVYDGAELVVTYDGKKIYSEMADLSPVKIYEKRINVDEAVLCGECLENSRLQVTVCHDQKELVSYRAKPEEIPVPAKPAVPAKAPAEIITNEELYITGQHIEQYRHASFLPDDYYLEGLKRDEGDIRINNAYGLLLLRRGRFELSEKYFGKAIERLTKLNPNPYDSEAFYNLGLSLFYQEKYDDAFDAFYKATWTSEQQEMSFYYLAAISARRKAFAEALDFVDRALVKNGHSVKARGLRAFLLYKLGDEQRAMSQVEDNLQLDCFDYVSKFLKECILSDGTLAGLGHESCLIIARDLAEWGLYSEALKALYVFEGENPMIHYYKGAYIKKLSPEKGEDERQAREEFEKAEKSTDLYCFPNKMDDIAVLYSATETCENSPKALFRLGCLFYDKLQYDIAIALWERALKLDPGYPTLQRNLSIALYNKRGEKERALELMERAFELDREDARVFLELDQLRRKMQIPLQDRLKSYEENIGLIEKRDDLYTEYVTLLNTLGMHEKAHDKICCHVFRTWEGAEGKVTSQFKKSLVGQAKELLHKNDAQAAKELLLEAISYPENLGEGRLEGTTDNDIYYYLGVSNSMLGDESMAKECYQKATKGAMEVAGVMYYYDQPADMILYQGLAFLKLGQKNEANSRFYRLLDYGEKHIGDKYKPDYFAVSMPDMSVFDTDMDRSNQAHCYYLMGLAYLGLGDRNRAKNFFEKVLSLDISHQDAASYKK